MQVAARMGPSWPPSAVEIDSELRQLAGREALYRLLLGRLVRPFLHRRFHHELGFACLGDYARERLGLSARELQSLAHVAERLERLPATREAFVAGELSWTQVRLLADCAKPEDEAGCLELARGRSLRALEAFLGRPWDRLRRMKDRHHAVAGVDESFRLAALLRAHAQQMGGIETPEARRLDLAAAVELRRKLDRAGRRPRRAR